MKGLDEVYIFAALYQDDILMSWESNGLASVSENHVFISRLDAINCN